jgi:hypothetical protein
VSARRNFGAPVETASLPKVNLQITRQVLS